MWDPREDSYIQELAARIEALDQLHQAVVDFSQQFSLDPLIDRIEALEAAQQLADHIADANKMVAPPAPAGGLVERVSRLLAKRFSESRPGTDCTPFARAAIREVASWLRSDGPDWPSVASLLEQEANR